MKSIKLLIEKCSQFFLMASVVLAIVFFFFFYIVGDREIKITPERSYKQQVYSIINDEELNSTEQGRNTIKLYSQVMCKVIGEGCTSTPTSDPKYYESSMISGLINTMVLPYEHRPASGAVWAQEGLANAGFAPKIYAQGIGFYGLQPLAPLWKAFRNLSYMVLVLGMVMVGFLIMFRYKIDPQTTISIEASLPRFAYVLLTITFSFAIAGFLIDLMYLLMGLGVSTIVESVNTNTNVSNIEQLRGVGIDLYTGGSQKLWDLTVENDGIWHTGYAIITMLPPALKVVLEIIIGGIVSMSVIRLAESFGVKNAAQPILFAGGLISLIIMVVVGLVGFGLGLMFASLIITLVIWGTVIALFFKILIKVFNTYTNILLWIIFAPIFLLQDIVPGKSAFTDWLKNIFVELLTFPLIVILIMIAGLIVQTDNDALTYSLWQPPFATNRSVNGFATLVGVVVLVNIPKIVDQVKEAFGVKGGLGYGVGSLFSGVAGAASAGLSVSRGFQTYIDPNKPLAKTKVGQVFTGAVKKVLPPRWTAAVDKAKEDASPKTST